MPIVELPSLEALGPRVDFQINTALRRPRTPARHTRARLGRNGCSQYLEENERPVVGLREGAMLRIEDREVVLQGVTAARIFRRGREPVEVSPEAILNEYLEPAPGR